MIKFILKQLFLLCVIVGSITAQTLTHSGPFNHLGAVQDNDELAFIKKKIDAGEQPWAAQYAALLGWTGRGTPAVDAGENGPRDYCIHAYANALAWNYTGNPTYANTAVLILNDWAAVTNPYGLDGQPLLVCGWIASILGPAAELMRNYPGWLPADQAKMIAMFKRVFYPSLNTMSTWNGNVDLTQIAGMLAVATYCEDETEFNRGIARLQLRNPAYFYLASDPPASRNYGGSNYPGSWTTTSSVEGLTQETCRDADHHAQFAMAAAFEAAEIAWHQGVDIYAANTKRYIAVLELMAKQLRTGSMQGTCGGANTTVEQFYNTFEIGYNHYHNRMGMALPETEAYIATGKNTENSWNILFEKLTHHGIIIKKDPPTAITVSPNPLTVPLNGTATATAVVDPVTASQNVTWKSSDPTIATVSAKGVVTGVAIGTANITATTEDGTISKSTVCNVQQIAVTAVSIDPATVSLNQGVTSQLKPVFTPLNVSNTNVTWKSSDLTVSTVSSTGLVTAVATGTATITVTTVDGGFTSTSIVTVLPNPKLLPVSKTAVALTIDGALDESTWVLNKSISKVVIPAAGTTNNTSTFGVLWDDTYLYVGVKVLDATITTTNANTYDNDAVELYFDMNNNGGVYDASDRSWIKVANSATIWEKNGAAAGAVTANSTVKSATKIIPGGYSIEFAIPWTNFNIKPDPTLLYGFDVVVDDADGGAARASQAVWIGDMANWQDLTNVGDLKLLNPVVIPTTITQDIQLVEGWNLISTNINPTDSSIATLFKTLDVLEIKTADAFWRKGQNVAFNSLNAITSGQAYLVNINTAGKLTITGTANSTVNNTYPTTPGWHLVGCPFQTAKTIASQITATSETTIVKNFDGFWTPNGVNSLTNIEPGKGYFIKK